MVFLKSICFLATIAEISITSLSVGKIDKPESSQFNPILIDNYVNKNHMISNEGTDLAKQSAQNNSQFVDSCVDGNDINVSQPPKDVDDVSNTAQSLTLEDLDEYLSECIGNTNELALLLDYDGTLSPLAKFPHLAVLPEETKNVLERLAGRQGLYIAIISGRGVDDVKNMVGIEGFTYAGTTGLDIHFADGTKYVYPVPEEYKEIFNKLSASLENKVCKHGAWVENKGIMLTYHYRPVAKNLRAELVSTAEGLIIKSGFKAGKGHCALEAKPPVDWDKGRASLHILGKVFGTDWSKRVGVIYVGDDANDEYAIEALRETGVTFRIDITNNVRTAAKYRLSSTKDVLTILKWVERYFDKRSPREDSVGNSTNAGACKLTEEQVISTYSLVLWNDEFNKGGEGQVTKSAVNSYLKTKMNIYNLTEEEVNTMTSTLTDKHIEEKDFLSFFGYGKNTVDSPVQENKIDYLL